MWILTSTTTVLIAVHGRSEEALAALRKLDFDMDEAQRDFLSTPQQQSSLGGRQNFALLFRGNYRSRTFLALFILGSKYYVLCIY